MPPPRPPLIDVLRHLPWPMVPGAIAFAIAFILQFVIKFFVDPDRASRSDRFAVRYNLLAMPPREVLTEKGEKLYWIITACTAVFIASLLFTLILCWNHPKI